MNKILYGLVSVSCIVGAALNITTPGLVTPGSITFANVGADSIITVNASNVTIDLQGERLAQSGAVAGLAGITVSAGLSNVTIKNGIVDTITGSGIVIGNNCRNIRIEDMTLRSCAARGIDLNGTGAAIIEGKISGCHVIECGTSTTLGDVGIQLTNCIKVRVEDCFVNNSGNATLAYTGIGIATSSNCNFMNTRILANTGLSINGFLVSNTDNALFENCSVRGNTPAAAGALNGFSLIGTSAVIPTAYCVFKGCTVVNNVTTGTANGYLLGVFVMNNAFMQCLSVGNSGGLITNGYLLTGGGVAGTFDNSGNTFDECGALYNVATTAAGVSTGWNITASDFGQITRSIAAYNTATASAASIAAGMTILAATNGQRWYVVDNKFIRNVGGSAANSFGIRGAKQATTTGSVFVRNLAYANSTGTASAQQLAAVPAASLAAGTIANLNTITSDYTNLGIPG